jgi:hypothetical protein
LTAVALFSAGYDESTHLLLESGRVFSTESGEKYRVPREADMTGGQRFSWISVGCSSIALQESR